MPKVIEWVSGEDGQTSQGEVDDPRPPAPAPDAAAVDAERDRRAYEGFEFPPTGGKKHQYNNHESARVLMLGAVQLANMAIANGLGEPGDESWGTRVDPFTWTNASGVEVEMDAPTVVEFGLTAARHYEKLQKASQKLKTMPVIPPDFADDKWWQ